MNRQGKHIKRVNRALLSIGVLLVFADGALIAHAAATARPEPTVTQVMTKDLPDLPGKEGMMLLVTYPPGGADPVHHHDADAFVYVLEGSVVMGLKGGKEVTLSPGQTFYEGPHDVHTVGRNASDTQPAKFVVVLVKDKGKPALMPIK